MFMFATLRPDGARIGISGAVCNYSGASETLPNPFELSFKGYR